jgi:hypothetical protein
VRSDRVPARMSVRDLPSGRSELLHGLHLPVGGGARLQREEPRGVGGVDHLHPAPPTPDVPGHRVGVVPAAHGLRVRAERERLPDEPPGDRVAVAIEGHAEAGRDDDAPHLVGVVGLPEREQVRPLLGDEEARDLPGHAVLALVGHRVPPGLRLGVEVGEVAERPPRPEVRPEVLHTVLDAPLLIPAAGRAGHGLEAAVAGVREEAGVPAHQAAPALRDGGGQVVVLGFPAITPERGEGVLVTAQEGFQALAEGELDREPPGVAAHEQESVDGAPDPEDVPELAPIDLHALAWGEGEGREGLVHGGGPQPGEVQPERGDPAPVARGPQVLEAVHGGALRVLGEERLERRGERREERHPRPGASPRQGHAPALHHLPDALPVHPHVVGDPSEGPAFRVGEAEDLGLGGSREHGAPPSRVWPPCTIPAAQVAIESRIRAARPLIGPYPQSR